MLGNVLIYFGNEIIFGIAFVFYKIYLFFIRLNRFIECGCDRNDYFYFLVFDGDFNFCNFYRNEMLFLVDYFYR